MCELTEVGVNFNATIMAAVRAIKTQRPDALFSDPSAAQLAGKEAIKATISRLEEYEKHRTQFFDDFLNKCSQNIRQIVLLGSGMDTRAYRLNWQPGTHVYEIDRPDILLYKEAVLNGITPNCNRHSIYADLKKSIWTLHLITKGFQPS